MNQAQQSTSLLQKAVCTGLAVVLFAAIVGFPWVYWEAARMVMRDEAPASLAWLVSKRHAESVWWGMGLSFIVWAPLSVMLGGAVGFFFLKLGFSKPRPVNNQPWAPIKPHRTE
ncbi:hypothetical protein [Caenimonas aquaedulcis]|uniref:Uncharacterized protein n=1 Tax=Caenimonas aquaedulcis TaxID=2793270 RepID=A0A931H7T0_9BURK|nr:hypothetical protein [Caenimonas aquaedulcis]MBG9390103.1 hypothetical protein [Caenimonas aquaedulcis]